MIPFMKDIEMRWPRQLDVSPSDVNNLNQEMTHEIMGARKLIEEHLNPRIRKVEKELQDIICNFETQRFSYYPESKTKPAQISFGAETVACTPENLAKAEKLTKMIEATAQKRLTEEKAYSEWEIAFLGLQGRIETLGGTIVDKRPFFDVVLPLSDGLGTESHQLLANEFNYLMLENKVSKLEQVLEQLTKKTSSSS